MRARARLTRSRGRTGREAEQAAGRCTPFSGLPDPLPTLRTQGLVNAEITDDARELEPKVRTLSCQGNRGMMPSGNFRT